MARSTIDFSDDRQVFTCSLPVRISDVNYFDHLGHDALVSMLHEARARFFRDRGHHESDTEGCACIVSELAVVYKGEARFGDDLRIDIASGKLESFSCELLYRIRQEGGKKLIALAMTGHVFFNEKRSLTKIPAAFRMMLSPPGDLR